MIDGGDSDHILMLVSGTKYYEVWNANVDQTTRTVTNFPSGPGWATGDILDGPGAGTLGGLNDGTRAANFSWAAGLITGQDLVAGRIDHALAVALPAEMLKGGGGTAFPYRAPATSADFGGWGGRIEMGSKIGIPTGTPRPAGLSIAGNWVFDALQKYGAYVGDYAGGPWPNFYVDKNTVSLGDPGTGLIRPLFAYWEHNGSSDMEKIGPLLRVADYQP